MKMSVRSLPPLRRLRLNVGMLKTTGSIGLRPAATIMKSRDRNAGELAREGMNNGRLS